MLAAPYGWPRGSGDWTEGQYGNEVRENEGEAGAAQGGEIEVGARREEDGAHRKEVRGRKEIGAEAHDSLAGAETREKDCKEGRGKAPGSRACRCKAPGSRACRCEAPGSRACCCKAPGSNACRCNASHSNACCYNASASQACGG